MDVSVLIEALEEIGIDRCSIVSFGGDTAGTSVIDSSRAENRLWVLQPGENGTGCKDSITLH